MNRGRYASEPAHTGIYMSSTHTADPTTLGWACHIHPNGWKYFRKDNLVTDVDVAELHEVENYASIFQSALGEDKYEISVSKSDEDEALKTLLVNHEMRCASEQKEDIMSADGNAECYDRRIAYWEFMCRYPSHRPLPPHALSVARQLLDCYIMDALRRRSESHAPFSLEQSRELLEYLQKSDGMQDERSQMPRGSASSFDIPSKSASLTALVSWIMLTSARHGDLHKYGQRSAHDFPSQRRKRDHPSYLIFSMLCFGAPRSHLHRANFALTTMKLQGRVDAWAEYLDLLNGELQISVLVATVVLTAAVSFLAVPGMVGLTLVITLLTVAFTLGSIMTGIYLQWQTGKIKFGSITASRAALLSVFFSIPFALLTWAMILFTAAVLLYSFFGIQMIPDQPSQRFDRATYISVFTSSFLFICIISVTVVFFRHLRYTHRRGPGRD